MSPSVTQTDIFGILARAGLRAKHVLFADERYLLPHPDWILGEFTSALRNWSNQLDISYRAQDYDCDDFARFAATLAGLCHRRTAPSPVAALAFGEMWYLVDGILQGHAINLAIVGGEPRPTLFFYDPQSFARVTLDPFQLATVEVVRF